MKLYSKLLFVSFASCILGACGEKPKPKKPISLGDTSQIVIETDSNYLGNRTEDISPTNKRSSESQIAKMMVQVDSLNTSKKLEEKTINTTNLTGHKINFAEFEVVFNNLYAHALNNNQDERNTNSVSYVRDGGDFLEMLIQVKDLENPKIEQRLTIKLSIEGEGERYVLDDLGKVTTQWFNLVGKDMKFVSLGSNSLQFKEVNQAKIKNALDRELRSKKRNVAQIKEWMSRLANTKSHTDAPCKLIITSAQWRIIGTKNGKRVQKLIQFDSL